MFDIACFSFLKIIFGYLVLVNTQTRVTQEPAVLLNPLGFNCIFAILLPVKSFILASQFKGFE